MAANAKAKRETPDEALQLRAFRACPELDLQALRELCPEVVATAAQLADTLSVCPEWSLLALLSIAGGLVPRDRFEPAPSISISSSMWVCLLHPGATNSSGVIRVISMAVEKMFERLWRFEMQEAEKTHAAAVEAAGEEAEAIPDLQLPPKRQLLAGGGSLAATGLQMSLGQNRSACLSAEPELDQVLSWFTAEASIDKGAPAKLWDGVTWHRPVMDKSRAFSVPSPWYGFICGGHIPELFNATLQDTFGLRRRLTVCFGHPTWMELSAIREACGRLPVASNKPDDFVAGLLFPIVRWSVKEASGAIYRATTDDGADKLVEANFNEHTAMQKDAFLKPGLHEEAKYHGQLRTKFDRMAIAMHVLHAVCKAWWGHKDQHPAAMTGDDWGMTFAVPEGIPANVIRCAYAISDHCEKLWTVLDFSRSGHELPAESEAGAPTQALVAHPPAETFHDVAERLVRVIKDVRQKVMDKGVSFGHIPAVEAYLDTDATAVELFLRKLPVEGITRQVMVQLMQTILAFPGRWFTWSKSDPWQKALRRITQDACKDLTQCAVFMACLTLQALSLGRLTRSLRSSGGGRTIYFFEKRPVDEHIMASLAKLGISDSTTPSVDSYGHSVDSDLSPPARAPPAGIEVHGDETKIRGVLEALGLGGAQPVAPPPLLPPAAAALLGAGSSGAAAAGIVPQHADSPMVAIVAESDMPSAPTLVNGGFGV